MKTRKQLNRKSPGRRELGVWPLALLSLGLLLGACDRSADKPAAGVEGKIEGQETAVLTHAPDVPPPITRHNRTKVIVNLEIKEVEKELAPGVRYMFWTFGGSVPGMFIRVREGDLVEFHLSNHPDNKMPHNIDLHAVTGQGGGAGASVTAPGHTSVFSFTALNPGLFVYHCATAPVGMHIGNGMYGLILVEPKEGLPKVDKEFYIMQSEFYTKGRNGDEGLQPFDMEKAIKEDAEYVVFNGSVTGVAGDRALKANVGETVRLFVGNGGPNLVSSFHLIGEIFDRVYSWGGTKPDQENVQTVLIPSGGSTIVEFGLDVPSTYIIVDHSIFRAFNKGALGMLQVTGKANPDIYSGKQNDEVYLPEGSAIQRIPDGSAAAAPAPTKLSREEMMERGARTFKQVCAACHQVNGEGLPHAFPPLANSDYLMADKNRAIDILLHGKTGEITVNGQKFDGVMPQLELDDATVASVLTYIRNSFGNKGDAVTIEEVKARRK
jgi:nitrite reductase (NO-forming)